MAKKKEIVWSQYLTERTLLRAWYILENNYFKSSIKKYIEGQGGKVSSSYYSKCHNALYTGIYFPNREYETSFKPLPEIKKLKMLPARSGVIANTMPPYEILQNIHAMHTAGKSISNLGKLNQQLNTNDLYLLSNSAGKLHNKNKVDINLVNKNSQALKPVQENCYRFVKKIKNDLKLGKPVGTVYSEGKQNKQNRFNSALQNYNTHLNNLKTSLNAFGVFGQEKHNKVLQSLDNGLYDTIIANLGFSFDELTKKENASSYITTSELKLHTAKLKLANKKLSTIKSCSFNELCKNMEDVGGFVRLKYMQAKQVYPECNKGFYNSFAEMLSKNYESQQICDNAQVKNYPEEIEQIIKKMQLLKNELVNSKDQNNQKQIMEKIDNISQIL